MTQHAHLPIPDSDSLTHSIKVATAIKRQIMAAQGHIPFEKFMEYALYASGLGYYSAGSHKLGKAGDFVTAPELSPIFSQCLANQCAQLLKLMRNGIILEFGAGTGVMAKDILLQLEREQRLPQKYWILELSADLKERQLQTFSEHCPHLLARIAWLDQLPEQPFEGIILANEVLDAMPVSRFHYENGKLSEYHVTVSNDLFEWCLKEPRQELTSAFANIEHYFKDVGYYVSEINLNLAYWLRSISKLLLKGLLLIIDYGFPAREFYLPERNMGTLNCHFRHRSHDDPLIYPGIQDITAHVDFTAIAELGQKAGFTLSGYTSQALFLINSGLEHLINQIPPEDYYQSITPVKYLTLPTEMGELFKAVALTRNIPIELLGFKDMDRRHELSR